MPQDSQRLYLGNPELRTLRQILSSSEPSLVVPDYQRSYSWERAQYEEFWRDLNDFTANSGDSGSPYFLGAMVLVDGDELEILDGQQRVATATILFSSLAQFFKKIGCGDVAAEIEQKHILEKSAIDKTVNFRLTLNAYDRTFFKDRIQLGRQHATGAPPKLASHRNIDECKEFFDNELEKLLINETITEAESHARALLDTLRDKVHLLSVTAYNFDLAADVFERLNDRGIQLSTVDLVRMLMLKNCRAHDRGQLIDLWGDIMELDGKANADDLLRYHWITLEGDPTSNRLYRQIRMRFSPPCDESGHCKRYTALSFTQDLADAADVYRFIYDAQEAGDEYQAVASAVVTLNAKPLIPFLMKIHQFGGDRGRLAKVALSAFVRNRLIGKRSSTDFESMIYRVTRDLSHGDLASHEDEIRRFMIDDDSFKQDFIVAELGTQKQARFVLRAIELYLRKDVRELTLAPANEVHVEHIYPKRPTDDFMWDDHSSWVNRLGNQTLLSSKLNRQAQNAPFEQKKEFYRKSQLILTRDLLDLELWGPNEIEHRQSSLADLAIKVWPKEG